MLPLLIPAYLPLFARTPKLWVRVVSVQASLPLLSACQPPPPAGATRRGHGEERSRGPVGEGPHNSLMPGGCKGSGRGVHSPPPSTADLPGPRPSGRPPTATGEQHQGTKGRRRGAPSHLPPSPLPPPLSPQTAGGRPPGGQQPCAGAQGHPADRIRAAARRR